MSEENSDKHATSPWHPINGEREPVAPSKPRVPSTGSIPVVPESIDGDDGEIIAPVEQPDHAEIMPNAGSNPWHPATDAADTPSDDAIRNLGDSAVRSASLSASGAPTPLGGIPLVNDTPQTFEPEDGNTPVSPVWVAGNPKGDAPDSANLWPNPTPADPASTQSPLSPASAFPVQSPLNEASPLNDESPAYVPPVMPGSAPAEPSSQTGAESATKESTPWYRSLWFLIIIGLLVMGGIGYGVYALFFAPEDVTLEAEVLVDPAPTATIEPIALEDPSEFLSAMPGTVGMFALSGAVEVKWADAGVPIRAAEIDDLTYTDGTETVTVRAIQHYDEEAAIQQYDRLSEGGTEPEPVTVGGSEVGERVVIDGDVTQYVWRNATAVFVASGPAAIVEDFYANFGL
ncbi:hypothetical protein [Demequina sediminicola]|uniref:hypothetical protein n=1 Tax=Demequina sediminicola TaxID=1095026 RepID=UPI000AC7E87B|nr:hypothetical protein [Demequina sediminicola]